MSESNPFAPNRQTEPLLVHEGSLAGKVSADSEAGDILDQQVYQLAVQLVTQLNVLWRLSRSHGRTNTALDRPVEAVRTIVNALGHDEPVALRVNDGFVFLRDKHLRATTQILAVYTSFMDLLAANGVGGVVLSPKITARDVREFVHVFSTNEPGPDAFDTLRAQLSVAGVEGIDVEAPAVRAQQAEASTGAPKDPAAGGGGEGASAAAEASNLKQRARGAYGRAAAALQTLDQGVRESGTISFRQARRAIQSIVDILMKDSTTVLALTTLRSHDEYTHNHSVNVALLSMALANRVGYPKVELADLGLAAMFHDVGKCAMPLDVLNKPGDFTPPEWDLLRTHCSEGVLALIRMRGLDRVPGRMAAAAFEHHMDLDLSGYPKLNVLWNQSLASRIVTIADCYDAMTASRVYRRDPLSPATALEMMLKRSGQRFDPVLLKLFVTCIGILPIGTLVLLDTGELAVVVSAAPDRESSDRPAVRIIATASGVPVEPPLDADLREKAPNGAWERTIVRLVDHTEHRIDTSRYVVA